MKKGDDFDEEDLVDVVVYIHYVPTYLLWSSVRDMKHLLYRRRLLFKQCFQPNERMNLHTMEYVLYTQIRGATVMLL